MATLDELDAPGFLSEDQLAAVNADGNFFLLACPGSGKTRCAGARVARLAAEGTRVAATSYTNVGAEEIRRVLTRDLGQVLPSSCFLGTLHTLLLRYVYYPFGHLPMKSKHPPRLLVDDGPWDEVIFGGKNTIRLPLSGFAFRPDGSLCVRRTGKKFPYDRETAAEMEQEQALKKKLRAAKQGLATFEDSMYWSLKVLEENDRLAKAIARRFEEILIDEGQDTSELQLAALECIWKTGELQSLVVVGDIEQSIFAFQGASPSGCERLIDTAGLRTLPLTKNHRSSQLICDVAARFCRRDPDEAVGEHAECEIAPELHIYDPEDPTALKELFAQRIEAHQIDAGGCVLLARGGDLVDELNDETEIVGIAKNPLAIGRATAAFKGGVALTRRRVEAVDRIVALAAWGLDLNELDREERWKARLATIRLLATAPDFDRDLRTWIEETRAQFDEAIKPLAGEPRKKGGQMIRSAKPQSKVSAKEFFTPPSSELRAQTVHGVKGESHDGVMIAVDRFRSAKHGAQGTLWSQAIEGDVADDVAEEIRIAFVAMTRARRYCALALPKDTADEIVATFVEAGFRAPL